LRLGRGVDADDPSLRGAILLKQFEARNHACERASRDCTDDDRVEEDTEFFFLLCNFESPASEAETTKGVVGCPGWDVVLFSCQYVISFNIHSTSLEPGALSLSRCQTSLE
jgi:hypothetical protein